MRKPNKCDYCPKQYQKGYCGGNCTVNISEEDMQEYSLRLARYDKYITKKTEYRKEKYERNTIINTKTD